MKDALEKICKNCEANTNSLFCENCGQKTTVDKITFKETLGDFFDTIFSVNAPLLITIKLLVINPGKLFREYLSGKRKTYYKPVAFFILISIIYLLIRSLINYNPFTSSTIQVSDETTRQLLSKAREFMLYNIDKFLFVFVFTLGLLLKFFFFRKRSFAEFIAISFYLLGFYTFITILNMFFIKFINNQIQFLAILVANIYFTYAMVSFFQKRKFLVAIKSLIVSFIAFFLYASTAFGISFLIIWFKYH